MSPSLWQDHIMVMMNLSNILQPYITSRGLGQLECGVKLAFDRNSDRVTDIIYLAQARVEQLGGKELSIACGPDLCVDVLWPRSFDHIHGNRFDLYADHGVENYWTLDPGEGQRIFTAYKRNGKNFEKVLTGKQNQVVRVEPFPELDISLVNLWPPVRRG